MTLRAFVHLLVAIVLLASSIGARYWLGRKRFHRTNPAGLLEFRSYNSSLAHRFVEGIIKVASALGIILGLGFAFVALFVY